MDNNDNLCPISNSYINETSSFDTKISYIMENFYHKGCKNVYAKTLDIGKKYIILIKIKYIYVYIN